MSITIKQFGGLRIIQNRNDLQVPPDFPRPLFHYLSFNPEKQFSRQTLAETVWPDLPIENARKALNTAVWRLSRTELSDFIDRPNREMLCANFGKKTWIDTGAFIHKVTRAKHKHCPPSVALRNLKQAIALYDGSVFCDINSEWALQESINLENTYCDALILASQLATDRNENEYALGLLRELVRIEPYREDVRKLQILIFAKMGNLSRARQCYKEFQCFLQDELGVDPSFRLNKIVDLEDENPAQTHPLKPQLSILYNIHGNLKASVSTLKKVIDEVV